MLDKGKMGGVPGGGMGSPAGIPPMKGAGGMGMSMEEIIPEGKKKKPKIKPKLKPKSKAKPTKKKAKK
jgi:hypothetical protein